MDYIAVLKRAWNITWRYRILWLFGFLAGTGGGSGSFNSSYRSSSRDVTPEMSRQFEAASDWVQANIGLVIALTFMFLLFATVMWVLSIMAQGALVHLVDEAEEGRPVTAAEGFRAGFRYWGRTFLIGLALALPILVLVLVLVAVVIASVIPLAQSQGGGDALAAMPLLCGVAVVMIPVLAVAGFVVGILQLLGLRYGILEDRPAFEAIGAAWGALRSRFKDVLLMWLVVLLAGFVYGIVVGVVAVVFAVPIVVMAIAGNILGAVLLGLLLALLMALPSAIYATFLSAAWTVFFRRLTGREVMAAPVFASVPPSPPGYMPPPPPHAYVPEPPVAPPAYAPEPPAPEPPPEPIDYPVAMPPDEPPAPPADGGGAPPAT